MKPIILESPEHAPKLAEWLATRGGIAVWRCQDLGSPLIGQETFTPALNQDGTPTTSPHWSFGDSPDRIVADAALVSVRSWTEVARVKVRTKGNRLSRGENSRLESARLKHGADAAWRLDYNSGSYGNPWIEAVIEIPSAPVPLSQFQPA